VPAGYLLGLFSDSEERSDMFNRLQGVISQKMEVWIVRSATTCSFMTRSVQ
jgi:hypothetical protein